MSREDADLDKAYANDSGITAKARHMAGRRTSQGLYRYTERQIADYLGIAVRQVFHIRRTLPKGCRRPKAGR